MPFASCASRTWPVAGTDLAGTFQAVNSNWSQDTSWPFGAHISSFANAELTVSRYSFPGTASGCFNGIRTILRSIGATSSGIEPEATTSASAVKVQEVV